MPHLLSILLMVGVALAMCAFATSPNVRDALLKLSRALPASTTAVTTATAIDTGASTGLSTQEERVEYLLTAPAVTTGQLPDAKTFTYDVVVSVNSDLSSPTIKMPGVIVQTGAGGAGAVAATYRFRAASDWPRYIGFKVTPSGSGTGDASGATATLEALA